MRTGMHGGWKFYKQVGKPGPAGSILDNNKQAAMNEVAALNKAERSKSTSDRTDYAIRKNKRGMWEIWTRRQSVDNGTDYYGKKYPLTDVDEAAMKSGNRTVAKQW